MSQQAENAGRAQEVNSREGLSEIYRNQQDFVEGSMYIELLCSATFSLSNFELVSVVRRQKDCNYQESPSGQPASRSQIYCSGFEGTNANGVSRNVSLDGSGQRCRSFSSRSP